MGFCKNCDYEQISNKNLLQFKKITVEKPTVWALKTAKMDDIKLEKREFDKI